MDNTRTLLSWLASITVFCVLGYFVWQANTLPKGSVEAVTMDVTTTSPLAPVTAEPPPPSEVLTQQAPSTRKARAKSKPAANLPVKKSKSVDIAPTVSSNEDPSSPQSPIEEPAPLQATATEETPLGDTPNESQQEEAPTTEDKEETTTVEASGGEAESETQSESQPAQQVPQFGTPGTMLNETQLSVMPGNKAPSYPWTARLKKQEGTVVLRAFIRENGTVDQVSIHQSSGSAILDKEAAEKYFTWKYNPGKSGWVLKPFKFSLTSQ